MLRQLHHRCWNPLDLYSAAVVQQSTYHNPILSGDSPFTTSNCSSEVIISKCPHCNPHSSKSSSVELRHCMGSRIKTTWRKGVIATREISFRVIFNSWSISDYIIGETWGWKRWIKVADERIPTSFRIHAETTKYNRVNNIEQKVNSTSNKWNEQNIEAICWHHSAITCEQSIM